MFGRAPSIIKLLTFALTIQAGALAADDNQSYATDPQAEQETHVSGYSQPVQEQSSQRDPESTPKREDSTDEVVKPIEPFTGKVVKSKVRLRLKPNLDGSILKELNRNEMVIVVGETEDFYAVQPPTGLKAFVFRTYILDNVVEGQRVNVRTEPSTDAPVIAQLNHGDRIQGGVSAKNNKWLEISLPDSTRLFVAKEYIEKLGDASLMAKLERRQDEVTKLLGSAYITTQTEFQKPFDQINFNAVSSNYQKVIKDYSDFPDQVSQAKDLLVQAQDQYLKKKVAFLESERQSSAQSLKNQQNQLSAETQAQQEKIKQLEKQLQQTRSSGPVAVGQGPTVPAPLPVLSNGSALTEKMRAWLPVEDTLYTTWSAENSGSSKDEFYQLQRQDAIELKGVLEPYDRPVKNKPGDYVLVNKANNLPAAYLYSTVVNLQDYVGRDVNFIVTPRSNNNFAYPAYFVLSVE